MYYNIRLLSRITGGRMNQIPISKFRILLLSKLAEFLEEKEPLPDEARLQTFENWWDDFKQMMEEE